MGTLGILWTSKGGQNQRNMDPKIVTMGENEKKMNQIHRQSFFGLVSEEIHENRSISPYGDLTETFGLRRGVKYA